MPTAKYALKQASERLKFKSALKALDGLEWTEKTEQYCDYRLDGKGANGWIRAKQFSNGTLYLEASHDTGLALMQGLLNQSPVTQKQTSLSVGTPVQAKVTGLIDIEGTYIGTDESGKGDYFGPLVIAGVLTTDATKPILIELGVMDSKKLTDTQVDALAEQIIEVTGREAIACIALNPAKYNDLYAKFKGSGKNLNHMLAWCHATVIETLLERFPDCTQAIADQFGSEHYIKSQLKEKGKGITLYQTPKAEANVGVAAASIIARQVFTGKMKQLSEDFGMKIPYGANPIVKTQAKKFVAQYGRDRLGEIAKLHFKTTQEI